MYPGGLPAPPPTGDPTARRARWPLVVGVVGGFALVGTLMAALVVWDGDTTASLFEDETADEATGDEAGDGSRYDGWDERVVDLVAFVERERGLEFQEPVQVDFLTEEDFLQELEITEDELTDEELEEMQDTLPMMRALGLMAGELDLLDTLDEYSQAATLAFYDDEEKRIVVPTTEPTLADEVTLVHELTHALQDQHFDLRSLLDDGEEEGKEGGEDEKDEGEAGGDQDSDGETDPSATELLALVEGDASRIETAYLATLPRSELQEFTDTYNETVKGAQDVLDEIPSALIAMMQSPYSLGEPFVSMIAADGGNEAVDRAFEGAPPVGKHLVDPRTYLDRDEDDGGTAGDLDVPALPDGVDESLDEGEFGALDVYFVLAERVELLDALAAADSWENGSYVAYEVDGRPCYRIALGSDDAGSLRGVFDRWAQEAPSRADATVASGDGDELLIESCDPGPDAELPHDRALEALELLSLRSSTAWELTEYLDMGTEEAWEIAECSASDLYDRGALDSDVSEPPSPDQQTDLLMDVLLGCGL